MYIIKFKWEKVIHGIKSQDSGYPLGREGGPGGITRSTSSC